MNPNNRKSIAPEREVAGDFATVATEIKRDGITAVEMVDSAGRVYREWRGATGDAMTLAEVHQYLGARRGRLSLIRRLARALRVPATRGRK